MASKLGTPKKRGDVKEAFELPSEELASHAQVNPTVEGTRTARVLMVSRFGSWPGIKKQAFNQLQSAKFRVCSYLIRLNPKAVIERPGLLTSLISAIKSTRGAWVHRNTSLSDEK